MKNEKKKENEEKKKKKVQTFRKLQMKSPLHFKAFSTVAKL